MNYAQYLYEHECYIGCPCISELRKELEEKKIKPIPLRRSARIRANTIISDPSLKETDLTQII